MESSENNALTPLHCKHRSPVVNFFTKKGRSLLGKASNGQTAKLMSQGQHSRRFKEANSFHVFPVVNTPPAKRFSKIVNPFEAALTDRLHLPLIASPTLFQRTQSPQHSSTQFAWTIDEVSSLKPANVEPHETQFFQSPDPEFEAKAQSAISAFFKEQQIVPSPIDCPLRSKRIVFSEISGNTPISKPGRRIRDNFTQTVLSLPPLLPKDLEMTLAPYFAFNEDQQSINDFDDSSNSAIEHDLRDASLRRKLFDYQSVISEDDDCLVESESCVFAVTSPPPQSPEIIKSKFGSPEEPFCNSDTLEKSSFGSLSPIIQCSSALVPNLKRKSRTEFLNNANNGESCSYENYRHSKALSILDSPLSKNSPKCFCTSPNRSLACRSSSPYQGNCEQSIESICNAKMDGLLVGTVKRQKHSSEIDLFEDVTQDLDEDDMQVSQLSAMSNISSESDTPRSKRRSASRKNLSQSFQCLPDNESENEDEIEEKADKAGQVLAIKNQCEQISSESSMLCRTDSGFNDMTAYSMQCDMKPLKAESTVYTLSEGEKTASKHTLDIVHCDADASMICCSTPSKNCVIP